MDVQNYDYDYCGQKLVDLLSLGIMTSSNILDLIDNYARTGDSDQQVFLKYMNQMSLDLVRSLYTKTYDSRNHHDDEFKYTLRYVKIDFRKHGPINHVSAKHILDLVNRNKGIFDVKNIRLPYSTETDADCWIIKDKIVSGQKFLQLIYEECAM